MTDHALPSIIDAAEIDSLAMVMAAAYQNMVQFYQDRMGLSPEKADLSARGRDFTPEEAADDSARIGERSPDRVSWFDLQRLVDRDPLAMAEVWNEIRSEARDELASGHRVSVAMGWNGRPWDRARFLAIRDNFRSSSPPQTGIESALIDSAAEAFSDYLEWTEILHMRTSAEVESERISLEQDGRWTLPHTLTDDAIEQAAKMAERAHARLLRTIKMLHEMQRTSSRLVIGHADQINVGQQQINVVASDHIS